jgi:hypothetical protein
MINREKNKEPKQEGEILAQHNSMIKLPRVQRGHKTPFVEGQGQTERERRLEE